MEMDITQRGNLGNGAFRCQTSKQESKEKKLCNMNT